MLAAAFPTPSSGHPGSFWHGERAPLCWWVFVLIVSFPCRYMVDAADQEKIEASKNELHNLLDKPQLQGIPVSCCLGRAPCGGGIYTS